MSKESPARFVRIDVSEKRTDKLWNNIQNRLTAEALQRSPLRARLGVWGAVAVTTAVLVLSIHSRRTPEASTWDGTALETSAGPLSVELTDNSRLQLGAMSRVETIERTSRSAEFRLTRGHIDCNVTPNPERRFTVRAGELEVRVTGTRFTVDYNPEDSSAAVAVSRGSVLVTDAAGATRTLRAGEQWSTSKTQPGPAIAPAASEAQAAHSALPDVLDVPAVPVELEAPALTVLQNNGASAAHAADAKQLFDQAGAARRSGNAAAAAKAYEQLLAQFPKDGRAGLSAFELARLRMDRLGDPAGSVQALKQALALSPSSSVSEDARARLVDAYQALGRRADCVNARDAYLKRYPNGVHTQRIQTRCQGAR